MISIFVEQEAVILPFTSNFFVNTKFHTTSGTELALVTK